MSTYVFVHGAFHGAWCWSAIEERLRAAGHTTVALDLPRGGPDRTPIADITLASVTARVTDAIDAAGEPVVLVAHSAGGLPASMAAEARPERVARAVFVTAALLSDGEALLPASGERDPGSRIHAENVLAADLDAGEIRLGTEPPGALFYNTCTPEQVAAAEAQLTQPIALRPLAEPVALTAARFGRVPLTYIRALQDEAFTAAFQASMASSWLVEDVRDIDCDHSPFLCQPDALSAILLDVA